MISLVYLSTATRPLSDSEMTALLRQSRENNARHDLTGLLLYKGDQFLQLLEGDDEQVDARYAVIAKDARHTDLKLLQTTPIATRQFSTWSMGFHRVTEDSLREIPGYNDFLDPSRGSDKTWQSPTRAQWLLDWFRLR